MTDVGGAPDAPDAPRPPDSAANDPFRRLLEAAGNGEEWAWSRLHETYGARLRGFLAARGVPDPDAAVGEVLVRVARTLPRFDGDEAAFDVEVFRSARRLVDDDPRRVLAGDDAPLPPAQGLPGHLQGVLDQLAPLDRDAILLVVVAGLTPAQVGEVLGISAESVDDATRRGLGDLSQVLF